MYIHTCTIYGIDNLLSFSFIIISEVQTVTYDKLTMNFRKIPENDAIFPLRLNGIWPYTNIVPEYTVNGVVTCGCQTTKSGLPTVYGLT